MAINYKASRCKNPKGVEGVNYYSCKASKTSDYAFNELADDFSPSTKRKGPPRRVALYTWMLWSVIPKGRPSRRGARQPCGHRPR